MRALRSAALLIACFIGTFNAQAQSSHNNSNQGNNINHIESTNIKPKQPKENVGNEPISFNTKAKDSCSMVISGQTDSTKLRVSCKNKGKTYWCEFLGKPNLCKAYNNNPHHFFKQIMWDMRKLHNACQGPQVFKPHMCRSASDDVRMILHSSFPKISNLKPTQAPNVQNQPKLQQTKSSISTPKPPRQPPKPHQPAKPASKPVKPVVSKPASPRKPVKTITPRPTVAQGEDQSTKLAEEYCWESLQGVCSYFISWFQN
ncbi:fibroblast growth factor-binding protein 2b [Misgurnus anguillicaudatus]|uniref:fibroblast growth factor-binding protein 2b n=1 Tax=Misgurnus anguillicaudatus TaxID=75329 RepID=UPI003CCFA6B5